MDIHKDTGIVLIYFFVDFDDQNTKCFLYEWVRSDFCTAVYMYTYTVDSASAAAARLPIGYGFNW